jgi:hypothetical protein
MSGRISRKEKIRGPLIHLIVGLIILALGIIFAIQVSNM